MDDRQRAGGGDLGRYRGGPGRHETVLVHHGLGGSSLGADYSMHIVAMIPADNYIMAQATNKVLLSRSLGGAGFGPPKCSPRSCTSGRANHPPAGPRPGEASS